MRKLLSTALAVLLASAALMFWLTSRPSAPEESPPSPSVAVKIPAQDWKSGRAISARNTSAANHSTGPLSADPIEGFNQWLQRYAGSAPQQRAVLLDAGVRLAQRRSAALYDLIRENPAQAVHVAIAMPQRRLLPAAITQHLEERIHERGELAVVAATPRPGGEHLITRPIFHEARIQGRAFDAYVYGRRATQDTKYHTSLRGIAIADRMAVLDEPAEVVTTALLPEGAALAKGIGREGHAAPEQVGPGTPILAAEGRYYPVCCAAHATALVAEVTEKESQKGAFVEALGDPLQNQISATATSETEGAKSVLVIVAAFSDATGTPVDIAPTPDVPMTSGYLTGRLTSDVSSFLQEASYGKTSIGTVTVTGVLTMPQTLASYATSNNSAGLKSDAINAATTAGFSPDAFDRIAVVFANTHNITNNKFTWSGLGDLGGNFTWFNGYFDQHVVSHELGHNFGLRHANLWKIPDGSTNPVDPLGQSSEYGDPFDVMGSGPNDNNAFPNPYFTNRLHWLPDAAVQTISTSGTYRVHRYDHQNADLASTLALRLGRDTVTDYWIGYRRKYQSGGLSDVSQGAYLLWSFNTETRSHLIDVDTPGTNTSDASLNVGQTFNDADAGISFTVDAAGGSGVAEYLDIQVSFQPRILFQKPTYSVDELSPSVTLTVERKNNSTGAVSAHFATVNGTAIGGSDFTQTSGDLTWASGDATSRTITIPLINNPALEGAEVFTVELSSVTGAVTPSGRIVTVTIQESGANDATFTPPFLGSAAHRLISLPDGRLVVVGNFGSSVSITSAGLVRLKENGVLDSEFDQGPGGSPLPLKAVALQHDGKVLVGGDFTSLRNVSRNRLARLNVDGTLDLTFDPGTGPNGALTDIKIQPDGQILVSGKFTTWNGIARRALVRLNGDGSLDTSLANLDNVVDPLSGALEVNAIALQPVDTAPHFRILAAGFFQRPFSNGGFHSGLVALNPATGARDTTFDVVHGAHLSGQSNSLTTISSIAVQPDRKVLVGGQFTGFNNASCGRLARLTSTGDNDSSFIGNLGGGLTGGSFIDVSGILVQGDGKIAVAGHFTTASGNSQSCLARFLSTGAFDTGFRPVITLSGSLLGGYGLAMQPDGKLVVALNGAGSGNVLKRFFSSQSQSPSMVQFASTSAIGIEGLSTTLTVSRTGGTLGPVSVNYITLAGSATAGTDYTTTSGVLSWADGDATPKTIAVDITNDGTVEADETFEVRLGNPLGGALLGDAQSASVTITAGDISNVPKVEFASASSSLSEGGGTLSVTLNANPVPTSSFTVPFSTSGSAIKGAAGDYTISTTPVTFAPGQATQTISITALQNATLAAAGKTITLTLGTPTGLALLGTNIGHTVTIIDDETAPVLTVVPASRIAALGSNVTFSADATGNPAPTFIWKKGTSTIAGQTGKDYTLAKVQTASGGSFTVTAKNLALSPPSSTIVLGILDKSDKVMNLYEGTASKATFTVNCSTNITGFTWKRNNIPVSDVLNHITGSHSKTLVITGLTTGDAGAYTCEVTCPGVALPDTTGTTTLNVINGPPVITPKPVVLPKAVVGGTYSHDVPYDHSPNLTPISFTATPLPTGLKIDAKGHMSGRVTVVLTQPKPYAVTFKATNAKSYDTATGNLVVDPLPDGSVGSFTGYIARNDLMPGNDGLGGRIVDLTTTAGGNITGSLIHGVTSYRFSGLLNAIPDNNQPTATITIPRTKTTPLVLAFTIDAPNQRLIGASLSDGTHSAAVTAWRKVKPASTFPGIYNLGLHLAVANAALPRGIAHATFTVGTTGSLTVSGKLADGIGFTTATGIGPLGEVLVHQSSASTDTVLGALQVIPGVAPDLSDSLVTGTVDWSRKQQSTGRLYTTKFGPVTLNAVGGRYIPKPIIMDLTYTAGVTVSNASLAFSHGDFGGPPALLPDVSVLLKTVNGVSVLLPTPSRKTTLKVNAATGSFSGTFYALDPNPLATSTNVLRGTIPFQGLVYRDTGVLAARGYYLLNNLPRNPGETSANTSTMSGKVELLPAP